MLLNWHGREDTLACLDSLTRVTYPDMRVVVVDNASSDGCVQEIAARFPQTTVLPQRHNLGFAGGSNVGIRWALEQGADYVLLLNNDTVVRPDFLDALVAASEAHPDAGVIGPTIFYKDRPDRIWFRGTALSSVRGRPYHLALGQLDPEPGACGVRPTYYVPGCCFLVRRDVWEKVGLLDDRYFFLWEDEDWCCRAVRAGLRCLFSLDSVIYHRAGASYGTVTSPLFLYFKVRNHLLWATSHLGRFQQALGCLSGAALYVHEVVRSFRPADPDNARRVRAIAEAVRDFAAGRFGPPPAWLMGERASTLPART